MAREAADAITGRDDLALAEALAARLCHDVSGFVGTMGAMLELAEDDPGHAAHALPLAREADLQLRVRLRLARWAWGAASDWPREGLTGVGAMLGHGRLSVEIDAVATKWGGHPALGRLLLNVAMLGGEVLQGRGKVAISGGSDGCVTATLRGAGWAAAPSWPDLTVVRDADPRHFQQTWTARVAAECARLVAMGPVLHIIPDRSGSAA